MKKLVMFFLLVGGSVFAQTKETRQVNDFSTIKSSQSIEVNFTYGGAKSVVVEVEKSEHMKDVKTEVSGGQLRIYIEQEKKNNWGFNSNDFGKVKVTVSNPTLEGVAVSSSAKFNLLNKAKAKTFEVKTSSSARFEGELVQADNLSLESSSSSKIQGKFEVMNSTSLGSSSSATIDVSLKTKSASLGVSSSAKINVSGSSTTVDASASSSGNIKGGDFTVKTLDGKASSSGSMLFNVTDEVSGRASSSGKVTYTGGAKIVSSNTSSSGKVSKVD